MRGGGADSGAYELLPLSPDEEALSKTHRQKIWNPVHFGSRRLCFVLGTSIVVLLGLSWVMLSVVWDDGVKDALQINLTHLKPTNATLRARQQSQYDLLKQHHEYLNHIGRAHNFEAMDKLASCLNGTTWCPERPVILSSYIYIGYEFEKMSPPGGEMIWFKSVSEMVENEGYIILHIHDYLLFATTSRLVPDLVHMYWAEEKRVISCVLDPRCIADYVPTIGGQDLSLDVPQEERGTIPLARLFATTWWGSYPKSWGHGLAFIADPDPNEWFSWNPLGPAWSLTPYDYPNNTFLPWSIENVCNLSPYTLHEDRKDIVLLYAKHTRIFRDARIKPDFWNSDVVKALPFKFITTAKVVEDIPLPEGLESLGTMSREDYDVLLGSVKAVVGLGVPTISPTVYSALCQGTPLVLPIYEEVEMNELVKLYGLRYSQHPMAVALGQPYVHTYMGNNQTQLIEAVKQTMEVNLDRFIPPKMQEPTVRKGIHQVLTIDFEAKAHDAIATNGGNIPAHQDHTRMHLLEKNNLVIIANGTRPRWTEDMLNGTW
ncbi:hypothetical protein MVEN_00980800 [Mycena venus]|uniref:alpha-1,6-mannosyl-glycoprotein 6-beta-N-acetylglucosaminyltransferase n=1 Tax=Mycena venus TaxID=2733690 RepID=A0A8H6YC94_9AGAR|nr:hypothetical protein MVEN_00980800 [Mycena venus]